MKRFLFLIWFFVVFFKGNTQAQDTIRVMQYNLMQYCDYYGTCTATNNNLDTKATNLKTIVDYVQPSIITVEEMGTNMSYVNHLLNNALNINGISYWRNGLLTNASGGSIGNMIYYDSRKFTLKESSFVQTAVRDFNIYRLYYNSPDLINGDTTFFIPIIGHLKAGTTDSVARNTQVAALMSRLNSLNVADNYILCGDFNIYTSDEPCYKQLLNYSNSLVRFYDPINTPGDWNNNYNFSHVHTQSTHTSGDCFSTGGMDDRFDFMLTSANVLNGYDNVQAITSSYHAVGQDGSRLNGTIISPTNNIVPTAVSLAMFNMSDHLPVVMDFKIYCPSCGTGFGEIFENNLNINLQNPVTDQLIFSINEPNITTYLMSIFDINGRLILQKNITQNTSDFHYSESVSSINRGVYILQLISDKGIAVARFVKQ